MNSAVNGKWQVFCFHRLLTADHYFMKVFINGESREIPDEFNLTELLAHLSMPRERVAVELNKEVVRKKDWETITVNDADKIEIIHFVGGG